MAGPPWRPGQISDGYYPYIRPQPGRKTCCPSPPEPLIIARSFPLEECSQCRAIQDDHLQHSIAVSADTDLPYASSEFHKFAFLPVEIQSKIWMFAALQPRTIPILTHLIHSRLPPDHFERSRSRPRVAAWNFAITPLLRIPPLLHTCSSSRAIALPSYYLVGIDYRNIVSEPHNSEPDDDDDDDEVEDDDDEVEDDDDEVEDDECNSPFDLESQGTTKFYINPSVDTLYFTTHMETHDLRYHTLHDEDESTSLEECKFCDDSTFPAKDALRMLIPSLEIRKSIKYLAFSFDLPGLGHSVFGPRGLVLPGLRQTFAGRYGSVAGKNSEWTGLQRVMICLEGEGEVAVKVEDDDLPDHIDGKGKEVIPVSKEIDSIPRFINLLKELQLYGIRESFTGPSAGKGNALFKKCMFKYSELVLGSQFSATWDEMYKPSGSLGVDGRPAVSYTGIMNAGPIWGDEDSDAKETNAMPILTFGVVRNYDNGEGLKLAGLDDDPYAGMCYDNYASSKLDDPNENSVFGCSVVMGEDYPNYKVETEGPTRRVFS